MTISVNDVDRNVEFIGDVLAYAGGRIVMKSALGKEVVVPVATTFAISLPLPDGYYTGVLHSLDEQGEIVDTNDIEPFVVTYNSLYSLSRKQLAFFTGGKDYIQQQVLIDQARQKLADSDPYNFEKLLCQSLL